MSSMLSSSIAPLLLAFFFALLLTCGGADTVHDLLPKYGLPRGLLPDAVKSYSLESNGDFVVELNSPCYVHFSSLAYYETTIKGKLSYGSISNIQGIQAKKLFVWVSVTGIVAKPSYGVIEFQVGFLSESLPLSEFSTVPTCKSSLHCRRGASGLLLGDAAVLPLDQV